MRVSRTILFLLTFIFIVQLAIAKKHEDSDSESQAKLKKKKHKKDDSDSKKVDSSDDADSDAPLVKKNAAVSVSSNNNKKSIRGPDMDWLLKHGVAGQVEKKTYDHKQMDWKHFSMNGFYTSVSMIVVSELGDKTFFIAAILAMKNSRIIVFLGSIGALAIMTVLAVIFGNATYVLLPVGFTHMFAAFLFLVFGIKLLYDGYLMDGGEANEELREVEEELLHKKRDDYDVESQLTPKKRNAVTSTLGLFARAFSLTFASEIGDRSQIATIVLAGHRSPYGVTIGAVLGHSMCTALAVLGGKLLASRISEKNVSLIGGVLFILFGLEAFLYGPL